MIQQQNSMAVSGFRIPPYRVLALTVILFALPQNVVVAGVGGSLTPARLAGALCLLWWLLARWAGGSNFLSAKNPIRTMLWAFLLVLAATTALAFALGVPDDSLSGTDRATLLLIVCCGLTLLACDGLDRPVALRVVFGAVVLGATASAVSALLYFTTKFDLRDALVIPGLAAQGLGEVDLARGGLERALGFAGHPIELSAICAAAIPLALHLVRHARYRPLWWLCLLLLAGGIVVSISRTGLLGMAVIVLLALPRIGILRWGVGVAILGIGISIVALAVPKIAEVLSDTVLGSSTDNSVSGRLDDYTYVASRLLEKPWSGQGFGTYAAPPQPYLDNQYLLTAVESGVAGTLTLILLLVVPAWIAWRVFRTQPSRHEQLRDAAWAVAVALLICLLCFATFDALAFPQFQALTFLLIGFAGALWGQATVKEN